MISVRKAPQARVLASDDVPTMILCDPRTTAFLGCAGGHRVGVEIPVLNPQHMEAPTWLADTPVDPERRENR
jgi:hypothetical protein